MKLLNSYMPLLNVNASQLSYENALLVRLAISPRTKSKNGPSCANGPSSLLPCARWIYIKAMFRLDAANVCAPQRLITCLSKAKLTNCGDRGSDQPSGFNLSAACPKP